MKNLKEIEEAAAKCRAIQLSLYGFYPTVRAPLSAVGAEVFVKITVLRQMLETCGDMAGRIAVELYEHINGDGEK